MSQTAVIVTSTSTSARLCPTSLRYDEPQEGGAYCSGTARTEVLQSCCAQISGKYECMKNKCYMPISKQPAWRACIQTEVFVCTAASGGGRTSAKAKVIALALALGLVVGVV